MGWGGAKRVFTTPFLTKAVSHPCRAIRDVEGIHKGLHAHLIHPRGAIGNIDDVDEDHKMEIPGHSKLP